MGEMADAILEGLFCEGCGDLIDGNEPGHPRRCGAPMCGISPRTARSIKRVVGREIQAERENRERHDAARARKPFECGKCHRLFGTEGGLAQHRRDTHDKIEGARR